ncbi:MAG: DUF2207 domain-containing protein [Vicinamibacterales bacterium]
MKHAVCAVGLALVLPAAADAKTALVQRFEALVRVEVGGSLEITETLVFRFDGGPFTEVVRELTTRNSDGVEVLDAWMNGDPIGLGEAVGQARLEGNRRDRIRWRFAPVADSTSTFGVRYLVRGAVRQDARGDLLIWRVPDGQHRWRVQTATIEYELPSGVRAEVRTNTHRAEASSSASAEIVRVVSQSIGANGWIETTLAMPSGSVLSAPPAWQEAQQQRAKYARVWVGAGGVVFVAGLIVLFGLRQGYEPPRHLHPGVATDAPPDSLPPALAGALVARGRPSLEHAAATLLVLADRGDLRVEESDRRTLGTRTYHLTRGANPSGLAPHEEAALAAAFAGGREGSVTLAKARTRLARRFRRFAHAVLAELDTAGLLDHHRQRTRRAHLKLLMIEFVLALAAFGAWPFLMDAHGAWPLVIFGSLAGAGITTLVAYGMTTPLTNEGVQRGRHWRAYRDYLKKWSRQKPGALPAVSLAYPVALGLAGEWSKHLSKHPIEAPAWFHSKSGSSAYAAFIAAAGAGAHGNSPPHHAH